MHSFYDHTFPPGSHPCCFAIISSLNFTSNIRLTNTLSKIGSNLNNIKANLFPDDFTSNYNSINNSIQNSIDINRILNTIDEEPLIIETNTLYETSEARQRPNSDLSTTAINECQTVIPFTASQTINLFTARLLMIFVIFQEALLCIYSLFK